MLRSSIIVWLCGAIVAVAVWYFQIKPTDNALMILGVMLSVLFGFYVTQLTVLIGSSASRFLYEKFDKRTNKRLLPLFVVDYKRCTRTCLVTIALVFIYLFFEKQITLLSPQSAVLIVSLISGLLTVALMRLKQMFDVMLQLLMQEAPSAPRQTLNDIESVRKAEIRSMMNNSKI